MPKQILVVANSSDTRRTIQTALQSANYQVEAARNGLDALDKLEYYQPNLILADHDMPGMTGDVLCQVIRRNLKFETISFILLTTSDDIPTEAKSLYRGADGYIVGPFSKDKLLTRVAAHLSHYGIPKRAVQRQVEQIHISLLNNISHELRTPLSVIIGFVQLLLEDMYAAPTIQQKFLESVYAAALRLNGIVENLIFLSQAQSDLLDYQQDTFSIEALLTKLTHYYRKKADGEIILNLPPAPLPPLIADYQKVKKTLEHLIDNAFKFRQKGQRPLVTISAMATGHELQISVQDNGIGLSDELIERIFEPFYQVDGSTKRVYEGAGAGLQIAQVIAKMHGGRIEVESQVDQGSAFTLILLLTPS